MHIFLSALLAGVAMLIADVLSDLLTQAVARNRALLAGLIDTVGWGAGIAVTLTTLDALNGHNTALTMWVVIAVSVANFVGSSGGVVIGKRFVKEDPTSALAARVTALETAAWSDVAAEDAHAWRHTLNEGLDNKELP